MPHAIYKYTLPPNPGRTTVALPRNARVLSFGRQDDNLVFWALIDIDAKLETRVFYLHWTGQPFDYTPRSDSNFIGTVQLGPFVYHLFEGKNV
jgi:hypothetical protein